ncbi:hypothetical protein WJX84_008776 [Apatococcus fuscideae]|uniref:Uncharacterized protein n=1 Tax=Apatococcus fuscideae TaxID=2026836 RepID=A0AAW1THI2_9CHLO
MSSTRDESGWQRWNTHFSTSVEVELFGKTLRLAQDPNSQNLGTTVWDASIVLAKWLEKGARRGEFARQKLRGKSAIELGAGTGLAGLALAMLSCNIVLTDTAQILRLLQMNYDANLSPAACSGLDLPCLSELGAVSVQELDWTRPEQYATLAPPYDFVLAADCVYHEELVQNFFDAVLAMVSLKTTVVICNEFRSDSVHTRFKQLFEPRFAMKRVPHAKMDAVCQHQNIDIYICKLRKDVAASRPVPAAG